MDDLLVLCMQPWPNFDGIAKPRSRFDSKGLQVRPMTLCECVADTYACMHAHSWVVGLPSSASLARFRNVEDASFICISRLTGLFDSICS
jgi:hypothetical protein